MQPPSSELVETARETAHGSDNGGFSATKLSGITRLKPITSYMLENSCLLEDWPDAGVHYALPSAASTLEATETLFADKLE